MDLYSEASTESPIAAAPGQGDVAILLTNSADSDATGSSARDDFAEQEFDIDTDYDFE